MGFQIRDLLARFRGAGLGAPATKPDVEEPVISREDAEIFWPSKPELKSDQLAAADSVIENLDESQFGALRALAHGYTLFRLDQDHLIEDGKIGDLDHVQDIMDVGTNQNYEPRPHDAALIEELDTRILFRMIDIPSRQLTALRPPEPDEDTPEVL